MPCDPVVCNIARCHHHPHAWRASCPHRASSPGCYTDTPQNSSLQPADVGTGLAPLSPPPCVHTSVCGTMHWFNLFSNTSCWTSSMPEILLTTCKILIIKDILRQANLVSYLCIFINSLGTVDTKRGSTLELCSYVMFMACNRYISPLLTYRNQPCW